MAPESPFSSSQIPGPDRGNGSPSRLPTPSKRPDLARSDSSHRRSLLPQIGLRKTALGAKPEGDASDAPKLQEAASGAIPGSRRGLPRAPMTGKSVGDPAKPSMPPPPVPSSLGRAQSLRKPATSQPTRTPSLRSHAPSASVPSTRSKPPSTTLPSRGVPARSSRPGSATSTRSAASEASQNNAPKPNRTERTRANTSSVAAAPRPVPSGIATGLKRAGSTATRGPGHTRTRSDLTAARPNAASTTSTTSSKQGPSPLDSDSSKLGRPAFSTLQQHFSPAKPSKTLALKKPTSAFLASSAPPPSPALPTETILLQTSLLQLHLLYDAAPATAAQWEASAEAVLRSKFDEVATAHGSMRQDQQEIQELVNLHALAGWQDGGGGLAEKVQRLGELLSEARGMADEDGRFARHAAVFEEWIAGVEALWARREEDDGTFEVAEGLGETWRIENAALGRKMAVLVREVELLGQPEEGSTVSAIVAYVTDLIKGMRDEIGVLRQLETDVVKGEERWVEEGLGDIAGNIELKLEAREARGHERWRMI